MSRSAVEHISKLFSRADIARRKLFTKQVDHGKEFIRIGLGAALTFRYLLMILASISITTIGIIVNSPVVVVGAMLISPLMGPIVLLGFSFCILDYPQLKASIKAIFFGVLIALASSYAIVKLSPIHEINDEIISRTNPHLYDLLIAIFSGIAVAYTVINRKGEEVVGIVLATSLMPPLAVVGFGLALGRYDIAKGAFLLFMTNLLAIAISVTIVARFYGFGTKLGAAKTLWQVVLTIAIFIILSIPLGITLKNLAYQIRAKNIINTEINQYFKENAELNHIKVSFPQQADKIDVKAVIFTDKYQKEAQQDISIHLERKLGKKITLLLEQVQYKKSDQIRSDSALLSSKEIIEKIKDELYFPTKYIEIDQLNKIIHIYPVSNKNINASLLYESEIKLQTEFPEWHLKIYPELVQIPVIYFGIDKIVLSPQEEFKLKVVIWMLSNWEVEKVTLTGFTTSKNNDINHNSNSVIKKRIEYIAKKFKEKNIATESVLAIHTSKGFHPKLNYYGVQMSQKIVIGVGDVDQTLEF